MGKWFQAPSGRGAWWGTSPWVSEGCHPPLERKEEAKPTLG